MLRCAAIVYLILTGAACAPRASAPAAVLSPAGVVLLPGVEGRMDHMAVDIAAQRLFVAGLENHSIEVVDLAGGRRVRSIGGIREPQGLTFVPAHKLLLVASRGDGTCRSFDTETWAEGAWVDLGTNADNVRFDERSGTVYVGCGGDPGPGAIAAIDLAVFLPAKDGGTPAPPTSANDLRKDRPTRASARAQMQLPSHPESFRLSADAGRIFVNVPDDHGVAVIDVRDGKLSPSAMWPVKEVERNFAMAADPGGERLFVVSRKPAKLLAFDAKTGRLLSSTDCVGDCDDVFYDATTRRVYVIGGEGFVDVFDAAGEPKRIAHVPTAPRARTGLFIPQLGLLCVAAPHLGQEPARILLMRVGRKD